jgi:ABC-type cobalamin transport system ATPase subunit
VENGEKKKVLDQIIQDFVEQSVGMSMSNHLLNHTNGDNKLAEKLLNQWALDDSVNDKKMSDAIEERVIKIVEQINQIGSDMADMAYATDKKN